MSPTPTLGARLRALRASAGLTQQHVAELARVSIGTVCKIERDRLDPRASTVARIERAIEEFKARSVKA